jgi:hypothetical protein
MTDIGGGGEAKYVDAISVNTSQFETNTQIHIVEKSLSSELRDFETARSITPLI